MKNIKTLVITLIAAIAISCAKQEKTERISFQDQFSIELPADLKKTTGLSDGAVLQYSNAQKELYVVVLQENKSELAKLINQNIAETEKSELNLKKYAALCFETLKNQSQSIHNFETRNTAINGLNAEYADFTASVSGVDIYYNYAILEGAENYYQLLVWTVLQQKNMNEDVMQQIITSFVEE